jgi:hypothetical protein
MLADKKRKEIHLSEKTLLLLEYQAKKEGRNLKNYIEYILSEKANELKPSKEYMQMMDELLDEVKEGKTPYITEEKISEKYNF